MGTPDTSARSDPTPGAEVDHEASTRLVPHHVGPYLVLDQLGHGGMGTVYLAKDPDGKEVAVKVLSSFEADTADYRRFEREGDLLLRLRHPNIVGAVGRGTDPRSKTPYIALELVRGRDLDDVLAERPHHRVSAEEGVFIIERCARALAAAHAQGVIHRDLKPGNVLLTAEGEVRLTDFGIALTEDVSERLTKRDEIVGTPHYVPPEVLKGANESWEPAADIYALGCLAYRMLTGGPVFDRPSLVTVLEAHVNDDPVPLEEKVPGLPADVCQLVTRLLSKDPEERPTAEQLAEELRDRLPPTQTVAGLWDGESDQRAVSARLRREVILPEDTTFHHFRIKHELGRGGMGVVYRAEHLRLQKPVALKVMLAGAVASEEERRRFLQEAEAAASLRHPNLVQILDAGEHEGTYYLTMEYVEGQPLSQWIGAHADEPSRLLETLVQVCDGVDHAHKHGIVHRDLKPENVIVDPQGVPQILDFGIAKRLDQESLALTAEGDLLGTVRYMAPEQAAGDPARIGPRSDVYSLGTILYEMLTGSTPFTGKASEVLLQLHLSEPPAPSRKKPGLPWELDAICLKALEKDPADRYASAEALKRDLENFLAQRPVTARQATAGYRVRKWANRNRRQILSGLLGALLVLSVAGAWALQTFTREQDRTRDVIAAVAEGIGHFRAGAYSEAAKSFDRASQNMSWDDQLALPDDVPQGGALEISSSWFDRARLNEWLLAAEERRKLEYVEGLIGQIREAMRGDRLEDAGNLMLGLSAVLRHDEPRVQTLRREVATRFLEAGRAAVDDAQAIQRDDFLGRSNALDRARGLFEMASALEDDPQQTRTALAEVRAARAELESDRERSLREKEWLAREVSVTPAGGIVADGAQQARISVALRNPEGEALEGLAVKFEASGSGNTVQQPSAPTDAEGRVRGAILSTVAEIKTLTVIVNPGSDQLVLLQQPTVEFVPGAVDPTSSTLEASKPRLAAGAPPLDLVLTLRDAKGNPVPGQRAELRLSGGPGVLAQPPGVSDAQGRLVGQLSANSTGPRQVSAVVSPGPEAITLAQTLQLELVPGRPSPDGSRVAASPASGVLADGQANTRIEVLVRDAFGNPIPGRSLRLEASGRGNLLTQPSGVTDSEGKAWAELASSVAEIKTITVVVSPGAEQVLLSEQPSVEFMPGAVSAEASAQVLEGGEGRLVADGAAACQVRVRLRDAQGNPVPAKRVELAVSGGGNLVRQPGPTDERGEALGEIASTVAEVKTVTVTVDPHGSAIALEPSQVAFHPGAPDPETSRVELAQAERGAGDPPTEVRVLVRDAKGNPVPGRAVKLELNGSQLTQPGATDAAGWAEGSVACHTAGDHSLTVVVDPGPTQVELTRIPTISVLPGALDVTASSVQVDPPIVPADGKSPITVRVLLRDAHGNPLAGIKTELTVSGGEGCQITPRVSMSGEDGRVEARLTATTPGRRTLRVAAITTEGRMALDLRPQIAFDSLD